MLIKNIQEGKNGAFYVGEENERLAEMVYSLPVPGQMIIEHTEVSDALRGKNVGYGLLDAAVEYARTNHLKIIPACPFARAVFKKKPELSDVLFNA